MEKTPQMIMINSLKKQLSTLIVKNNYNLLHPDILTLSHELDDLMLPLFREQLDLYNKK